MIHNSLMLQTISNWFKRNFSDPEALGLFFFIVIACIVVGFFGNILLPVFISVVIAYLLNSVVQWLSHLRCPQGLAVGIVFSLFLACVLILVFALLPLLWRQLSHLVVELPKAFSKGQLWLTHFAKEHPSILSSSSVDHIVNYFKAQSVKLGQLALSYSLAGISSIIEAVIYLVLVPLLVFFFLKDGKDMATWLSRFLPSNRGLIQTIWLELHQKIGAYVQGRAVEMLIVGIVSVLAFSLLDMQYAFLIGILVGVSVIVPYIGAIIVTIPVCIIGLMQWGISPHLGYLLVVYGAIIAIDANILFPILFSETMDLHPIVIILSVLIFGGIWGFWGVFFAIPLATLVKAIFVSWPQVKIHPNQQHKTKIVEIDP